MSKLLIQGGIPLRGTVKVNGSKNASLPIMAAALLCEAPVIIDGVPDLHDVKTMAEVLRSLGASVEYYNHLEQVVIDCGSVREVEPPPELVQRMRASFLVLGSLLARHKRVRVSLPGGCAIGTRPVDLHLKGLSALGGRFTMSNGCIEGEAPVLRGTRIYIDYPSVGATENIITAAVLAHGTTVLENAAKEPEIVDLANFLNSMGARISGAGTSTIRIEGVEKLSPTRYQVIPDRIEAGTLLLAGAITGGDVTVENVLPEHLNSLLAKLREAGVQVEETAGGAIRVNCSVQPKSVDLKTLPYPGFSTDLQPQFMALLCISRGTSVVTETVFENRFRHVEELTRMGAQIQIDGSHAVVHGQDKLGGAPVRATDLRAAAALVLTAMAAQGVSEIADAFHLWRGYSRLEERLTKLGARIRQVCFDQALDVAEHWG